VQHAHRHARRGQPAQGLEQALELGRGVVVADPGLEQVAEDVEGGGAARLPGPAARRAAPHRRRAARREPLTSITSSTRPKTQ